MVQTQSSRSIDLRQVLRIQTADVHAGLEALWSGRHGFRSFDAYSDFLRVAFRVHSNMGWPAVQIWGTAEDAAEEHKRISSLARDLRHDAAPAPASGAHEPSESYAWGVAYVLNGSSLGASVMMKRGDIDRSWPCEYMQTGRHFVTSGALKRFFDRLNRAPLDEDQVALGAKACFTAFTDQYPSPIATTGMASGGRLTG